MKDSYLFERIFRALKSFFPDDVTKKRKEDPFWVLVGTIISQRTKDEVTDEVLEKLKKRVNRPEDLAAIDETELEKLIFPAGFYRNKARTIKKVIETLLNEYGGKVPDTLHDLLKLKGIGRKTANLVLSEGYGKPAICVDVHVHRISNRIGLVNTKNPEDTEIELRKKMPMRYWKDYNKLMVRFGRTICRPISPFCSKCPIADLCLKRGVERWR